MSSISKAMIGGALAGAVAGVATGIMDGLWSFGALGQYLPSFGGKLTLLVHLAFSYSLAMGVAGAGLGLLGALLATTRGQAIWTALLRGSPSPTLPLSFAIVAPPIVVMTSAASYLIAFQTLVMRKHPPLVIASAIIIAVAFLAMAVIAILLLAELLERSVSALAKTNQRPTWVTLAVGIGVTVLSLLGAYLAWRTRLAGVASKTLLLPISAIVGLVLVCALLPRILATLDKRGERSLALPLVLTALPLAAIGLAVAFTVSARGAANPPAILIAHSMAMALWALLLALILGLFLARALDAPLRRFAQPRMPAIVASAGVALAGIVVCLLWWKTLKLLPLRPFTVGAVLLGAAHVLRTPLQSIAARIPTWAAILALPVLFAGVVVSGQPESVQKAQGMHAGLSEPFAQVYRRLGDWDRDGSSRWLGGGDCDDGNPHVHPRADEIPFDGIDNNCLRGDVTERAPGATHFAAIPPTVPKDFNVLFLTIDTIRADHLGAYGYKRNTTPNLDALANDGTLFKNGWAHAPSTRYSIPAILTGRHPLNVRYHQIPGQWPGLSEDNTTIAEVMKDRGLRTGAILNYWYFDTHRKMNQGFDDYDNRNKKLHRAVRGNGPAKTSGSSSKEQSDKAIEYIDSHAKERFFLWVHYYDPHYDYEKHPGTPVFGSSAQDQYDHEIAYTDAHIGRVIDDLKARGLYEKTIIVVTGDHGEGFGEHGIDLHGYHLYAAQTKVPLLIRIPGTTPSVVTMPASHVDILPTLANVAGAASTSEMLGRSLLGVISGAEDPEQERYVFQQLSYENNNEYRGAVSSKCHALYNVSPSRSWELYRVDTDPMETQDIINTPGECAGAREALETWYDYSEIPDGAMEALLTTPPALESPISVQFGKAISLVEVSLPKTVRRGETATMTLTWKANARPPKGWKVFAHFEKSPGQASKGGRFTADHKPPRPFSWWSTGQFIRYGQPVNTAQNQSLGRYDLWFGIYRGNERMSVATDGIEVVDRRVKLATIEVIP